MALWRISNTSLAMLRYHFILCKYIMYFRYFKHKGLHISYFGICIWIFLLTFLYFCLSKATLRSDCQCHIVFFQGIFLEEDWDLLMSNDLNISSRPKEMQYSCICIFYNFWNDNVSWFWSGLILHFKKSQVTSKWILWDNRFNSNLFTVCDTMKKTKNKTKPKELKSIWKKKKKKRPW